MAAVVLCAVLGLFLYRHYYCSPREFPLAETHTRAPVSIIEVAGDVSNPGVFFFDHAPTVAEVLAACGERGGRIKADSSKAAGCTLTTGTLLRVERTPGGGAIDFLQMGAGKRVLFEIPIDLNAISEEDLLSIPGIGPATARKIIAYRKKQGC